MNRTVMKMLIPILLLLPLYLWADDNILVYLEGDVTILHEGEEFWGDFGSVIFQGDTIKTGQDSLAIIDLGGRGELKLVSETLLLFENTGTDTYLDLKSGSLFSKIHKLASGSFSVQTQAVVAGIRGTEFFMAYGKQIEGSPDIWLCVNQGTVEVAIEGTEDSRMVEQGEGINILSGKRLTEPQAYAWTEDLNWNTDPSRGTVVNETNLDNAYDDLLDQDYF